jgi:hypothetical protein
LSALRFFPFASISCQTFSNLLIILLLHGDVLERSTHACCLSAIELDTPYFLFAIVICHVAVLIPSKFAYLPILFCLIVFASGLRSYDKFLIPLILQVHLNTYPLAPTILVSFLLCCLALVLVRIVTQMRVVFSVPYSVWFRTALRRRLPAKLQDNMHVCGVLLFIQFNRMTTVTQVRVDRRGYTMCRSNTAWQ